MSLILQQCQKGLTHDSRGYPRSRESHELPQDRQPQLFCLAPPRKQHGRRPIRQLTRVPRRRTPIRFEHGLELPQSLRCRSCAHTVVETDNRAVGKGDGGDFRDEVARGLGDECFVVRGGGEGVLLSSGDAVLGCDVLPGVAGG